MASGAIRGVSRLNRRARKVERLITLFTVCVPLIGVALAVASLWDRGISTVELVTLGVMYSATVLGIGIGYHRLFSHRSFRTTAPVQAILAVMGSMAAQGPVLFWVAIHRRHHAYSDCEGDPHSPNRSGGGIQGYLQGFCHAHTTWLFNHEITSWAVYVPDLLHNKVVFLLNRFYLAAVFAGLAIPAIISAVAHRSWGAALGGCLWGGMVRVFLVHHTTWSINSVCHLFGTHPFRSRDYSGNVAWLALFTFGESWHNNHHAFPSSAIHGLAWWQIDVSGYIIRVLEQIGMVWDVKIPTPRLLDESRHHTFT